MRSRSRPQHQDFLYSQKREATAIEAASTKFDHDSPQYQESRLQQQLSVCYHDCKIVKQPVIEVTSTKFDYNSPQYQESQHNHNC